MARRIPLLGVILVSGIVIAGCGDDSTPTTPTPPPVATPPPAPPPPPPPPAEPAALASLTLNPTRVTSQGNPEGTVTLTAAAPAGGAVVALSSGNPAVATVPANVTIAAGSTSNTFRVSTTTVNTSSDVTIIATYAGQTRTAALTVLPPPLEPRFTVTSPSRGTDTCEIVNSNGAIDCELNASASGGFIARYHWILRLGSSQFTFARPDGEPVVTPSTTCGFMGNGTNQEGRLEMEVELQLEDRAGNRSSTSRRTVTVYHNGRCGY